MPFGLQNGMLLRLQLSVNVANNGFNEYIASEKISFSEGDLPWGEIQSISFHLSLMSETVSMWKNRDASGGINSLSIHARGSFKTHVKSFA